VVQGLVLRAGRSRLVLGDALIHVPLDDDLHLEVPADAFSQVHPALNPLLVATVLEHAAITTGARALDLYCGAGNFALPLARRGAQVLGIEAAKLAVDAARANAARVGVVELQLECGDVAAVLTRLPDAPLDVAVLDPPDRARPRPYARCSATTPHASSTSRVIRPRSRVMRARSWPRDTGCCWRSPSTCFRRRITLRRWPCSS